MAPVVNNDLTDRERELMALAWLCFSEKPKVRIHPPSIRTIKPHNRIKPN